MKGIVRIILTLAVSTTAFAQGKVTFGNDANHLVVFSPDAHRLTAAYRSFAGQPVPQTGTVNMGLFTVELLAGTTAWNLSVVSSGTAGQTGFSDGRFPTRAPVTLPVPLAGGIAAYFQVRVWETAAGSWDATTHGTGIFAWLACSSPVFTCVPGSVLPNSIVLTSSP